MGGQAILARQVDEFNERIRQINERAIKYLDLEKAAGAALEEYVSQNPAIQSLGDITGERLNDYNIILLEKLKQQFLQDLTPEFKIELHAFFDSLMIYFNPQNYQYLFSNDMKSQDSKVAIPLLEPTMLEGRIRVYPATFHSVTKDELISFLKDAQSNLTTDPIFFILAGQHYSGEGAHAITIGFDPANSNWYFIDANKLPIVKVTELEEIAACVMAVFQKDDIALLYAEPWGLKGDAKLNKKMAQLKKKVMMDYKKYPDKLARKDSFECTLLHAAVKRQDAKWTKALLRAGADPNARNKEGWSPLYLAIKTAEYLDVIEILAANGADLNEVVDGHDLLSYLVNVDADDVVEILLEYGADPYQSVNGKPPVIVVAAMKPAMLEVFLDKGADPNYIYNGMTLMHLVAGADDAALIKSSMKLLIESGGDINLKISPGNDSPLELLLKKDKLLAGELLLFIDQHAENKSKEFITYAKQRIINVPWKVQGLFGGSKIILDNQSTIIVPRNVKAQWDIIIAAEQGKIPYKEAEKRYVEIARNVPDNSYRDPSTRVYYGIFKSPDCVKDIRTMGTLDIPKKPWRP